MKGMRIRVKDGVSVVRGTECALSHGKAMYRTRQHFGRKNFLTQAGPDLGFRRIGDGTKFNFQLKFIKRWDVISR